MKTRLFQIGILTFALVFGMTVIGCDDDDGGGGDGDSEWVNVTSLAQIEGTWKASYNGRTSTDEDVTWKEEYEWIYNINASTRTVTIFYQYILTFSGSGSSFDSSWITAKEKQTIYNEAYQEDPSRVTIDESAHKITETGLEKLNNEEVVSFTEDMQINQNGTKLKHGYLILIKQ